MYNLGLLNAFTLKRMCLDARHVVFLLLECFAAQSTIKSDSEQVQGLLEYQRRLESDRITF